MQSVAKLKNSPHPARKMRLLADLIRGKSVDEALNILRFHSKRAYATEMEKLLKSAISNWEQKFEEESIEDAELFVSSIMVDSGKMLKRIQPAPQGRAHRIRKRTNHITVVLDSANDFDLVEDEIEEPQTEENN